MNPSITLTFMCKKDEQMKQLYGVERIVKFLKSVRLE